MYLLLCIQLTANQSAGDDKVYSVMSWVAFRASSLYLSCA
jgi:hypothetical protein